MGVVVRRYIDIPIIIIIFPYSTCISSFFGQQHPYFFVHFLNVFSFLGIQVSHCCLSRSAGGSNNYIQLVVSSHAFEY